MVDGCRRVLYFVQRYYDTGMGTIAEVGQRRNVEVTRKPFQTWFTATETRLSERHGQRPVT